MKKYFLIIVFFLIFILVGCKGINNSSNKKEIIPNINPNDGDDLMDNKIILKIDDTTVDVTWEDNNTVKSLKVLAKNELKINMNKYSTFEQVGSLGSTLVSNDTKITTSPGDIVLYSSNQIVIFYGSNTWNYTKLGHINLSNDELLNLLGNKNVIVTLTLE